MASNPSYPQYNPPYQPQNYNQPPSQTAQLGTSIFGEEPVNLTCPGCHQQITTKTNLESGFLAWLSCILLALFGCFLGCCLIPFCVSWFKDVEHKCPNCGIVLGRYKRMG
uniref:LITAF domain-containing protein n=1 Tax=Syphacia muris TaxID=451379 RepID=A0A0N5AH03_9BILA